MTPITLSEHITLALLNGATQIRMPVGPPIQMRENEELDEAFTWFAPELPPEVKAEEGLYYRTNNGLIFHAHSLIGAPGDVIGVREEWKDSFRTRVETAKQSPDEFCTRVCLNCQYIGVEMGLDSCDSCSTRYEPKSGVAEDCPQCQSQDYSSHCPKCDSDNFIYVSDTADEDFDEAADTMPDEAIRLKYRIESVKVEKFQEITEDDAMVSGLTINPPYRGIDADGIAIESETISWTPLDYFVEWWNANNPAHPWEGNPFVWIYSLEKI